MLTQQAGVRERLRKRTTQVNYSIVLENKSLVGFIYLIPHTFWKEAFGSATPSLCYFSLRQLKSCRLSAGCHCLPIVSRRPLFVRGGGGDGDAVWFRLASRIEYRPCSLARVSDCLPALLAPRGTARATAHRTCRVDIVNRCARDWPVDRSCLIAVCLDGVYFYHRLQSRKHWSAHV